ncbi:Quinone oxidoreductase putative, YhdH/YhfP [Alkaliphilus metalliredigens QYMF]|uniref:Quinone oxidoreductase putative, YhdH/YhfP n=1 Tax=Alkaliphilus metalliredigens (strain QYMF) TaxID=293826 RepID=A6TNV8_ALKMQ|nr:acryloyl-CoA reductase [Alkaliphilus metalliredigens]ABR47876.1 Quinone oxidoreductase putative, YhdH/YhfP [Alkaliphilus metalliredigens QYMF]
MSEKFRALVVNKINEDFTVSINDLIMEDLPEGEVTIRVAYSSVNYKDGLASIPEGQIVKSYPFIPGIDLVGTVVTSTNSQYQKGDEVIVTSYGLGVSHYGGYSEYARVPAHWVVPLPKGLTMKEAMAFGTAGFTAALSVYKLEEAGLTPDQGPVLVTGATGGVGSVAIAILAKKGYEVVASTGKASEHEYLKLLGAKKIISRSELQPEKIRGLGTQMWAGAVDPVGGDTLAYILSTVNYGGAVAVCGLTGGVKVPTTVFPFILRGIKLLGIDSVDCPMKIRKPLWQKMAGEMKPDQLLSSIGQEVTLDELPNILPGILKGKTKGRLIVKI